MPLRIQRKRDRGWRMPKNTVYVGRPTKWGNPHPVTFFYLPGRNTMRDANMCSVKAYAAWLAHADRRLVVDAARSSLRGKT